MLVYTHAVGMTFGSPVWRTIWLCYAETSTQPPSLTRKPDLLEDRAFMGVCAGRPVIYRPGLPLTHISEAVCDIPSSLPSDRAHSKLTCTDSSCTDEGSGFRFVAHPADRRFSSGYSLPFFLFVCSRLFEKRKLVGSRPTGGLGSVG